MPYNFMQAYNPYAYYPQPQQQSGMLWVSGEQEAYGYPVAPNGAVALWDSGKPTVYLKQADASGKPNIKILDYTERAAAGAPQEAPSSKGEIETITKEIESLKTELKNIRKELRKRAIEDDDT